MPLSLKYANVVYNRYVKCDTVLFANMKTPKNVQRVTVTVNKRTKRNYTKSALYVWVEKSSARASWQQTERGDIVYIYIYRKYLSALSSLCVGSHWRNLTKYRDTQSTEQTRTVLRNRQRWRRWERKKEQHHVLSFKYRFFSEVSKTAIWSLDSGVIRRKIPTVWIYFH